MLRTFPRQVFRGQKLPLASCLNLDNAIYPKLFSSSSTDSGKTSSPPRRPRHFFRKFVLVALFSSVTAAGLLYTNKSCRDLLTDNYPVIKPSFKQIETLIGGWYGDHPIQSDSSLPFINEHKRIDPPPFPESHPITEPTPTKELETHLIQPVEDHGINSASQTFPTLPTVEDVMQMTRESSKTTTSPAHRVADIGQSISTASRAVQEASLSLSALESTTRKHIEGLRIAIQSKDESKDKKWEQVSKLANAKDRAETKANAAVDEARHQLDTLRQAINDCKLNETSVLSDALPDGISTYGHLQYNLSGAIYEVRKLQNELQMIMRYRDLVHKSRDALQHDLDALRDHIDPSRMPKDGSTLAVNELNSLLVVAHSRISQLQALVSETEINEKTRLTSAFEAQRRSNEDLIADYVKRELERERNMHELDRYRWELEHREALQHEQRLAVARHSEHLSQMLRLKQEEMEHQFTYRLREYLAQEKIAFEAALSGWTRRMHAIEDVVDGRADLDRIAKETQALWIACEALAASLSSTLPTVAGKSSRLETTMTGPLVDFVEAIREAASSGSHPFVLSVLQQLSPEMEKSGVWMERGLKERFEKVYKVCRRVALVDETSGSLYTYILSWLQSVLTVDVFTHKYLQAVPWLKKPATSEPALGDDSEWNPSSELDTFSLLRSAKSALCMESATEVDLEMGADDDGIELAVRLLGQLHGQARLVAEDWLADARRYLEMKQATQVLLAYAAARGMSTYQKRL